MQSTWKRGGRKKGRGQEESAKYDGQAKDGRGKAWGFEKKMKQISHGKVKVSF